MAPPPLNNFVRSHMQVGTHQLTSFSPNPAILQGKGSIGNLSCRDRAPQPAPSPPPLKIMLGATCKVASTNSLLSPLTQLASLPVTQLCCQVRKRGARRLKPLCRVAPQRIVRRGGRVSNLGKPYQDRLAIEQSCKVNRSWLGEPIEPFPE